MSFEKMPEAGAEDIIIVDGRKFRLVPSGYTIRQYFSHETAEKGPGPGWDFRDRLEKLGIDRFTKDEDLPDDPYYQYEEVE